MTRLVSGMIVTLLVLGSLVLVFTVQPVESESAAVVVPELPGDVNKDGEVDMQDIDIATSAFGSFPGHPRWNSQADINRDDKVDMKDIGSMARAVLPNVELDLYGGASNEGYGNYPFPPPFGGQGPNNSMDLVTSQSEVYLYAGVAHNYESVQSRSVNFTVEYPGGEVLLKRTAVTDDDGIAVICFDMPWSSDDSESLFGIWTATATVSISGIQANDTLTFHYDYLITIFKVVTDKFEYNHDEEIEITIKYGTYAQQWYPVQLSTLLMDELIVPAGISLLETEVGGAEQHTSANFTSTFTIYVEKWMSQGLATIHVNTYDKDLVEGGVAWRAEYAPPPEIYVQPY